MKVILRTDITNVGRQGEVKEVAPGFARNYLLPRKLAMDATPQNMKIWEREKEKLAKQREKIIEEAKEFAEKIEKTSLTITVKTGDAGRLFGSVTNAHIARALEDNGITVERHDILLSEPIKEVGVYTVDIRLHPEVVAKAKVWVIEEKKRKEESAETEEKAGETGEAEKTAETEEK